MTDSPSDGSDATATDSPSVAVVDFEAVARRVFPDEQLFETICRYRDVLASRGVDWGLLGPREVDRLWDRHILNSAAVADLISSEASVGDVGSGAGLPGIPVAVLRPDLEVTLIEPLLRRSNFLTHSVDELGITQRVRVLRSRAEDVSTRFDAVLSRALAPLDRLVRWCLPLMTDDGAILAVKGSSAQREVDEHATLLRRQGLAAEVLSCRADPQASPATVVRLRRS